MKLSTLLFALVLSSTQGEEARLLRGKPNKYLVCPKMACFADPCTNPDGSSKCADTEECLTTPSYYKYKGSECPGCPVFDTCEEKKVEEPLPCPVASCWDPCMEYNGAEPVPVCAEGERCLTKQSYFTSGDLTCPGCHVFDSCVAELPEEPCPAVLCLDPCVEYIDGNHEMAEPKCLDSQQCVTKPTFFDNGCAGCQVFSHCV